MEPASVESDTHRRFAGASAVVENSQLLTVRLQPGFGRETPAAGNASVKVVSFPGRLCAVILDHFDTAHDEGQYSQNGLTILGQISISEMAVFRESHGGL